MKHPEGTDNSPQIILLLLQKIIITTSEAKEKEKTADIISAKYSIS